MSRLRIGTFAAGLVLVLAPFVAAPLANATTVHPNDAVTLYYDDTDAPNLTSQVDQAAANWDGLTTNVKLVNAAQGGGQATIIVHETNDGQGSYTNTDGHGNGDIYIDDQQIAQGYDPTRIAAHEFGHNLGLADDYSGPCSEIMSGHGPGTSCKNAIPDANEVSQVDANFANGFAQYRHAGRLVTVR